MDIQDKVEHISRALDNQAFSQELQSIHRSRQTDLRLSQSVRW